MNLEDLVGQQIMIGVSGTKVTDEAIQLFKDTRALGLILFRPNSASAMGLRDLISGLESALGRRLLVAIDHEGGRVIHLTEGVTVFPDNWALGNTGNEDYARRQGEIEAKELMRLGIDLNLAPTVDVLTERFSPNIGIRSYGRDPELVARLGAARIKAMQAGGVSACAKHFPGQGQSPLDAHLNLPVLATPMDEMKRVHLKPFTEAINAGVRAIMTSHPVYPEIDPEKTPATFSKKVVRDLLRKYFDFKGAILSDDLEMGALRGICSVGEAAVRAIEAGHDMVLICHGAKESREAYAALLEAYKNGRLDPDELEKSAERIEALKSKTANRFEGFEAHSEPGGAELAARIAKEGMTVSGENRALEMDAAETLGVIFPRISSLKDLIFIEPKMADEKTYLQQIFASRNFPKPEIEVVGLDPSDAEIEKAVFLSKKYRQTIFFCYDAHLYPQSKKMLEEIEKVSGKLAVVLLRDPYDEEFVAAKSACVTVYGFRSIQIEAALEAFRVTRNV